MRLRHLAIRAEATTILRLLAAISAALAVLPILSARARADELQVVVPCDAPAFVIGPLLAGRPAPAYAREPLVDPATPLRLVFALKPRVPEAQIEAFVDSQSDPSSPNYRRWLTPEEFGARFGATDAALSSVTSFAAGAGMGAVKVWPNRMFVSVETDVAHADAAFGVTIRRYARSEGQAARGETATFLSPDRAPLAPTSVAQATMAVLGLSDARAEHAAAEKTLLQGTAPAALPDISFMQAIAPAFTYALSPAQVAQVYNISALQALGANGSGMTVGIYSPTPKYANDPFVYAAEFGLPTPNISTVSIDGGPPSGSTNYLEASLDMEMVVSQAPRAHIVMYESQNSLSSRIDAFNQMIADKVNVISSSWSADEVDTYGAYSSAEANSVLNVDLAAVSAGIGLFNDTGDWGAYDQISQSYVTTQLEASCPYTTAVGGTSLPSDSGGNWSSEIAWSYSPSTRNGGGGGISRLFARPSWQAGPGVANTSSNGYRQIPDVSALADPTGPGYSIVLNGNSNYYGGGTSASTPIWASVYALMEQLSHQALGNLNPGLYRIGTQFTGLATQPFHDIISGGNGVYSCTPNWDYVTGWGSADFARLYYDVAGQPNLHPYNPAAAISGIGGTWTSPIMVHSAAGDVTEPSTFQAGVPYYFAVCQKNDGPADAPASTANVQVDGVSHALSFPANAAGYYYWLSNQFSATFTPGAHTITFTVDSTNSIAETNENDNVFTRTITVGGTAAPALSSVTLSASVVRSGGAATGTATLSGNAGSGGITVLLSSSNTSAATVPAYVVVPAGASSATFNVSALGVTANTPVTISGTLGSVSKSAPLTVIPGVASVRFDVNGDGKADLTWWDTSSGQVVIWLMNGTQFTGTGDVVGQLGAPWQPVVEADLNGDGKPDILWWNSTTGQIAAWYLSGSGAIAGASGVIGQASPPWRPEAIRDVDPITAHWWLVWRNTQTGQIAEWLMEGTTLVSATVLSVNAGDLHWQIIGSSDVTGDGAADLIWWNSATGQTTAWQMTGTTFDKSLGLIGSAPPSPATWQPVGVADMNEDHHPDIIWRNIQTGQVVVWLLNGTVIQSAVSLTAPGQAPPLAWRPAAMR